MLRTNDARRYLCNVANVRACVHTYVYVRTYVRAHVCGKGVNNSHRRANQSRDAR